ncbi:MAG: tripartite tricarboxylate transporter substrate binding protein [Deltaproteobacteria bacterium]
MKTRWIVLALVIGGMVLSASAESEAATAGWVPSKPVEFVVQAAPGGGSDIMARTIASLVEAQKLSPTPFVVVNKPGGGSVVGTTYVAQQKGNPHVLATYHSGNLVAPITAGVESATVKNLTVLAAIAIDEQLLVVNADSPFKSVKDVVAEAKKRPGAITVGGTATGQDDQICNRLFERAADMKLRYVPFNSGGEAMTALLGGHVEMIWANPSEFAPQLDAKQVRLLGVAKEERLPYMAGIPTFKEQGYNVIWKMFRSVVAPGGIPRDAIAYYESTFKKMSESSRWKEEYLKKYMLTSFWMGNQEATKFVAEVEQTCTAVLKELGLGK